MSFFDALDEAIMSKSTRADAPPPDAPAAMRFRRRGELNKAPPAPEKKSPSAPAEAAPVDEGDEKKRPREGDSAEPSSKAPRVEDAAIPAESDTFAAPTPPVAPESGLLLSTREVVRRLRRLGEPIRLFGESDKERETRLRELETTGAGGDSEGQRNLTRSTMARIDMQLEAQSMRQATLTSSSDAPTPGKTGGDADDQPSGASADGKPADTDGKSATGVFEHRIDDEVYRRSTNRVSLLIHDYLKFLTNMWDQRLLSRPDYEQRSRQGRDDRRVYEDTKLHIQPLLRHLRRRTLEQDMLQHLTRICDFLQRREYRNALDTYYLMSIGNAPWPMGVTMVGIHERSAREKISSNQVAHVLNDERTRRWIHCLKRLMTLTQDIFPPEDLVQAAGFIPKLDD
ncbi:hypothetical protein H696_04639 [Fonticula alba]|uniref:Pre-mRNA-splicing factor 18 n=1 Tax=Fonticula alba TaxID=691883 RepID=A0A058Z6R1_FONAL|nr:hypothetical protein H696_04639 [Fonticula alba]KCV69222.1 hypothetical protein H696_04639 [Fonticula alba]|eukprot:XP_009496793.1 hypothetical protein H696_04639 [Fonticula alba]